MWHTITKAISHITGVPFIARTRQGLSGGCINQAWLIGDGARNYFVKLNQAPALPMFQAERAGLEAILDTKAIRTPTPLCHGVAGQQAFLVLEYIASGRSDNNSMTHFGRQLAAMHRHTATNYGWHIDNTIGSTPQINTPTNGWGHFWQQQRIGLQLELAARNGYRGNLQTQGVRLLEQIPLFFRDHQPPASLLHGDLWSGNYFSDRTGMPVIFDPATYYGDRETDMAMTELFGGFPPVFYHAYHEAWPLPDGYRQRQRLYNLYHLLNHLNLFGTSYLDQVRGSIDRLLSELR